MDFLERLHLIKNALELNPGKISKAIGVSQPYCYDIFSGRTKPNLKFFEGMARVYNVSLDYLVLGAGEPFRTDVAEEAAPMDDSVRALVNAVIDDDSLRQYIQLYSSVKNKPKPSPGEAGGVREETESP